MRVEVGQHAVVVTRELHDSRAGTESEFWYRLKLVLNSRGFDLVKKIMARDGHMMGGEEGPYYLRDRDWRFCIYDPNYMLRALHTLFNSMVSVTLSIEDWGGYASSIATFQTGDADVEACQ
jgi:hypothetical protein